MEGMTPSPDDPVIPLDDAAAWDELRLHRFGRLAIAFAGEPDIFPINFAVDDRSLVFLTAEGTKLLTATVEGLAAFEVDRFDEHGATTVVVHGVLREVTDPAERAAVKQLPLRPWVPTYKTHYLRLEVQAISARSFVFGETDPEASQEG